jgi:hypothetical protein
MVNFKESLFDPLFQGLSIRPVTRHLVENLILDLPLEVPQLVDFGVDSANHYRALKEILFIEAEADEAESDSTVVREELRKRILALDEALGSDPKLNALVRRYAPQYADRVHFHPLPTSWDELDACTDEPQEKE